LETIITLKDIDLRVHKGEFVCIIGDVGSGKSSILSALIGEMLYVSNSQIEKFSYGQGLSRPISDKEDLEMF